MITTCPNLTPAQEVLVRSMTLLENGNPRGWVDLFSVDGVLEFPYAPPGWPNRFKGREVLWNHMQKFPEHLTVRFFDVHFYETADPEFAIGEYRGEGEAVVTGRAFHQNYISLMWTRNGEIVRFRDFWNPLGHLDALGGAEAARQIVQR